MSATLTFLLSSCGTIQYSIMSDGENLQALTQITKGENPCGYPFGGDNGNNLFYTMYNKKSYSYHIYKKENVLSEAVQQLTSGENFNYEFPTYCKKSEKVYFVRSKYYGDADIYSMSNLGGNAMTQVAVGNQHQTTPYPSTDGLKVVYCQAGEIWVKNLETGENTLYGTGYMPVFSPDNKTILYSKKEGDIDALYTMDVNGSNVKKITGDNFRGIGYARFSPDGKKIIFNATTKDKKDHDLYVIDIDGRNVTQLTMNTSMDAYPYWANDGYIYFHSDRGTTSNNYQIWRFKIENRKSNFGLGSN